MRCISSGSWLTSILVSHDPDEMQRMADRVFVLEEGKVVEQGRPHELFSGEEPAQAGIYGQIVEVLPDAEGPLIKIKTKNGTISCRLPREKSGEVIPGMRIRIELFTPRD
jgi:ABC-type sulfate/molybdate transport systems ATPase subunit